MDMRAYLADELARCRNRNPRYSLRAFARRLGTHHSVLSQVLDGRRRLTPRAIRRLGQRLSLPQERIDSACAQEHAESILRVAADPRFRADSRWIAMMAGIPIDDVNRALHHLLHTRRLTMASANTWKKIS